VPGRLPPRSGAGRRPALREVSRHPALDLVGVLRYDSAQDGVEASVHAARRRAGSWRPPTGPRSTPWLRTASSTCQAPSRSTTSWRSAHSARTSSPPGVSCSPPARVSAMSVGRSSTMRAHKAARRPTRRGAARIHHRCTPVRVGLPSTTRRLDPDRRLREPLAAGLTDLLFGLVGFGQPIISFDPSRSSYLLGGRIPLGVFAEAAGCPIDDRACTGEVAATARTTSIVAGDLAARSVNAIPYVRAASAGILSTATCRRSHPRDRGCEDRGGPIG